MNRIIKKLLLLGSMACIFFSILSTVFIYNPKAFASDVIEEPDAQQITEIQSIASQSIKINASLVNSRKKIDASTDSDMKSDKRSDMKALSAISKNLIVNGDFEYDPNYSGSWELYSVNGRGTPTFTWDNISHGNGESSVKISGKKITAFLGNTVSINPGKVYSLSTWSKGSGVSVTGNEIGSFISIEQYDKDGNYIDGSQRSVSSKGTFGWTPASIHFVADPNADSVFILLALDGSGSVWYDDVSLVETGNIPAGEINRYIPHITYKGFNVSLDGAKYSNVAATASTYQWEIQSKPVGSLSALANSNNKVTSFVPDVAGDYILSLTVSNGSTKIDQKQVTVKSKEFNNTTEDTVDYYMSQATSNYTNGYTLKDMIPLTDGWLLLGDILNSKIIFYNVFTGEIGKQYQLQAVPDRIDFDFNRGIILATQANTNKIAKIDVNLNTITYITTKNKNADVIFGEGNIAFASSSAISIIDINQNNELSTYTSNRVRGDFLAYDKNNNNLLLGDKGISSSTLMRFQYDETNQQLTYKEQLSAGENGQDLTISNDGLHVAYPNGAGNGPGYTIFDIDSSNITNKFGEWDTGAYPTAAAFSGDNTFIVTTDRDTIKLFDVNTHQLIKTYSDLPYISYGDVNKVGISRGDKLVFGYIDGTAFDNTNRRIYFNSVSSSNNTPEITLNSIHTNTPSPQIVGKPIQISANASGSSEMQYQFMIFDGYSWTLGQAYSENNTFSWTPDHAGNYSIVVEVKDNNSYFGYDAYGVLNYFIETPVPISLKANPSSLTLVQGQSEAFPTITGTLRNGSAIDVTTYSTFTSTNTKIATVENGKIKGMGPGSTTIRVSMGTVNTTINVTVKPSAKITAATGTAFKEGSENGQLITVKLTNGDINANPDNATVKLTGLPDGITQGKVTWLSKTSLTIALVGNSTVDYDTNATAIVTIDKGQVTPAQTSDLTSPVTLKATVETTPAAPAIIFSFDGINAGKLKGIKAGMMEYSLDGGTGYITAV
ncbi:hypothetical protein, partial [Paenibacillus sp. YIM B09110]|uniref:hypothetical protein n=1 Tax=Paenibacillus sp. YIM B09110 TaxID=3126102 RepID=UPI00301D9D44